MSVAVGQSMVAPLRRVIVKQPEAAYRSQRTIDHQFRDLNYLDAPDYQRALAEHARLVEMLEEAGAEVLAMPPDDRTGLDSIYVHDPALATDRGLILLRMGKAARRDEPEAMRDALLDWDEPVAGELISPATAEGGDLVWLDRYTLLAGRTYRTNDAGLAQLRTLLGPDGISVLGFPLPHWEGPARVLHLMSVLSLVDDDLAVVYPRLMPVTLVELLKDRGIQMVDVPDNEFDSLGCNVLALAPRRALIRQGNPETVRRLKAAGCDVWEFAADEIGYKGSGGPTCLTRPISRG